MLTDYQSAILAEMGINQFVKRNAEPSETSPKKFVEDISGSHITNDIVSLCHSMEFELPAIEHWVVAPKLDIIVSTNQVQLPHAPSELSPVQKKQLWAAIQSMLEQ